MADRASLETTPNVNRERFLALAAALAAASCIPQPPADLPKPEVSEPEPEPEPATGPVVIVEPAPTPSPTAFVEPAAPACDNNLGRVDCSQISSTCEGLRGSCQMLADGYPYKARVGESVARCWARLGQGACNMRGRKQCYREGIRDGCLDPAFEAECQERLDRCHDAGASANYTVDECVQVLSSLSDEGEREWASQAMGPTREGCRLMFPVY
ncbi:hypothetical protein ENSA5_30100 [Enhygromyxa salina]|uniref:Uncharacterized protein n=1 Tax=Enhygromyxa salina TaxID=215803 RepID=A0A2S9XZI4_9BACT|nr:hypothetical protein [Enhygromyxa salina]PRP98278.1 hypothetical protein ENSA5_30100 [Enhygromyxa salina]